MSGEVNHENNINSNNNDNTQKKKGTHYSRFLLQLYHILEDDKYKDIIHWGDNGKYFVIENVHDFTEKILPQYYSHNNYSSFVRQLNMYDFHKKKTNTEAHTFQHNKFIKGQEELIKTINRKRKKDKNKGITSLVPLNTELVKFNDIYNLNNINNKIDLQNQSNDKHSLSLDEEKDNTLNNQFNVDSVEHSLIEYNKKNFYPQNAQLSTMELKQNLLGENNINNSNKNEKKVTKKSIYDSLNCLFKNIEDNTKKQNKLNAKIDSLSNKNIEFINKNKSLLDEIKSKIDYNKKFETIVCFILEIQKIKNEGALKNILISNVSTNDNSLLHENQNDNLEIVNYKEPKQEINSIIPANDFLQKKTFNNGIIEPFQTFLNKYMEKNKNRGLLTNSEIINNVNMNNINNIINNKNEIINNNDINNNNNLLLTNGEEINNQNNNKNSNINNNSNNNNSNNNNGNNNIISKENSINNNSNNIINNSLNLDDKKSRSPSIDFTSSIFHRNRSLSFNSQYSNNTNNFNDNFNTNLFGNNNQNNSIIKSDINNDINFDNSLNKNFDADFNQDKNSDRKDSLNNSSISFLDYKSDKMSDIFGGDNNSINFS